MERYLLLEDEIRKILTNIEKKSSFSTKSANNYREKLVFLQSELKSHILKTEELRNNRDIIARYRGIKEKIALGLEKILVQRLDETEGLENPSEQETDKESVEEESEEDNFTDIEEEEEAEAMATLDLNLALKVVEKFSGDSLELGHFLETVDLLKTYSQGVSDANILVFLKIRLIGPAHGSIEEATTVEEAKQLLAQKFAVKLTPSACEREMGQAKQKNMTITEFGRTVEQLAAKLATAHVSARTFQSEARADAIVQPAAINAFINGLNNPQTAFFVKASNPPSLNRAISDALEVLPINKQEEVNWYHAHTSGGSGHRNARGNRGNFYRGRGNFRGRGFRNHNQNYQNNDNQHTNRGNYSGGNRGNGGNRPPRSRGAQSRGNHQNQRSQCYHCTEEGQPRRNTEAPAERAERAEEVNTLQELFRE